MREKVVKKLTDSEMAIVREFGRRLRSNALYNGLKRTEKVKAVIKACPPQIQLKLTNKKVKTYITDFEIEQRQLEKVQVLAKCS